jgi:hypothetical protein
MALIHLVVARAVNFLRRPIDMSVARRALGVRISLSDQLGERCKRIAPAVGSEIVVSHRLAPIGRLKCWAALILKQQMDV